MKNYLITPHLSYEEVCRSQVAKHNGLANEPNIKQLALIKLLAEKIIEPIADGLSPHLNYSSVFRTEEVNKLIGGSKTSDHTVLGNGAAVDIDNDGRPFSWATNAEIFKYAFENLNFDQLIWEGGDDQNPAWVHIGNRVTGNRNQVLRMEIKNGKKVYSDFRKEYSKWVSSNK